MNVLRNLPKNPSITFQVSFRQARQILTQFEIYLMMQVTLYLLCAVSQGQYYQASFLPQYFAYSLKLQEHQHMLFSLRETSPTLFA